MKSTLLNRLQTLLTSAICSCAVALLAGLSSPVAQADDIEVFFGNPAEQVNILFIIDSSWSMWSAESTADVRFGSIPSVCGAGNDPCPTWGKAIEAKYGAPSCTPDSVFFAAPSTGNQPAALPTCTGPNQGISAAKFQCNVGGNVSGILSINGLWNTSSAKSFQVAQNTGTAWIQANSLDLNTINSRDIQTACRVDGAATTNASPQPAPTANNRWKSYSGVLYRGDYLNFDAYKRRASGLRITLANQAVLDAIKAVENNKNVNVGLMRYNAPDSFDCAVLPDNGPVCNKKLPDGTGGYCEDPSGTGNGAVIVAPVRPLAYEYVVGGPNDGSLLRDYTQSFQTSNPVYGASTYPNGLTHFQKLKDILQQQIIVKGSGASSCDLPIFTPNGRTPLSESLYEAYLYFNGLKPEFGGAGQPGISSQNTWASDYTSLKLGGDAHYPSVQSDMASSDLRYRAPSVACARNAIILLSDGGTQADGIDTKIKNVIQMLTPGAEYDNREKTGIGADGTQDPDAQFPPGFNFSEYIDDFSKSLHDSGQLDTYVVGYKVQETYQEKLLERMAEDGGGEYFAVDEPEKLLDAFNKAITSILSKSAGFTSPAVSVNAFNRTQNADQVYISMFQPSESYRWNGNVKRYRLTSSGQLVDRDGDPAVNTASGYIDDKAWSFWSPKDVGCAVPDIVDGSKVTEGGAANMMRCLVGNQRKLYVQTAPQSKSIDNLCSATASLPSRTELGLPAILPTPPNPDNELKELVQWLCDRSGADKVNGPMGDPLHSRPALHRYEATIVTDPDTKVVTTKEVSSLFVATNDGMLHAVDTTTGKERWTFMPEQLLSRSAALYGNKTLPKTVTNPKTSPTPDREYGLDGNVRVFEDKKGDGKVYLVFGMRKGGHDYFALDVTDKDDPKLLWQFDGTSKLGQSWSTPQVTYIFNPADGKIMPVVFFAGGYDEQHEDGYDYGQTPPAKLLEDSSGAANIYMVDLKTGTELWNAKDDSGDDMTAMKYAMPADLRVVDLYGGDDIADRLYAVDLGGQLWRFDLDYAGVSSGSPPTKPTTMDELMTGGRLASLGGAEDSTSILHRRRFFYAPDVAIVRDGPKVWLNIAMGSGHREFPRNDTHTQDRLYVVRDNSPFTVKTDYSVVTTPGDLNDITDGPNVESCDRGWYYNLEPSHSPTQDGPPLFGGEKILAEVRTFGGQLFGVSTASDATVGECGLDYSIRNRLYVLGAQCGAPVQNLDGIAGNDPYVDLKLDDSISPEAVFLFPPEDPAVKCQGLVCRPPPTCLVGLELCPATLLNPPTRTYWKQRGMN